MQVNGLEKRLQNLRPYQPGENFHTRKAAERSVLENEIIAELSADNLTASDRLELRHAIELLTRRPRDHVDAVRCSNAGSRMIAKIRARIKQRGSPVAAESGHDDAAKSALAVLERLRKGNPSAA